MPGVVLTPHDAVRYAQPQGTASCRFTLTAGNRKEIRAVAIYEDQPGQIQMIVPAR